MRICCHSIFEVSVIFYGLLNANRHESLVRCVVEHDLIDLNATLDESNKMAVNVGSSLSRVRSEFAFRLSSAEIEPIDCKTERFNEH